jgi:hypothetical protein
MSIGAQITAATDRAKERRAAAGAKQAKRKEVRTTRKEYGEKKRTAAKAIRKGDLKGRERRLALRSNRVFHRVDKEGKPGGFPAFGKLAAKVTGRKTKRDERQKARAERKAARPGAAKRAERKATRVTAKADRQSTQTTKRQLKDSWKDKRKTVSKADRSFHKAAAKQKQMKEWEYYNKYVK